MEHYLPEIFWHDRQALLSVDHQHTDSSPNCYKIVSTSVQKEVRVWEYLFEERPEKGAGFALAVNFVANLVGHSGAVNVARFSPDGECLISGDCDGTIILWKIGAEPSSSSCLASDSKEVVDVKEVEPKNGDAKSVDSNGSDWKGGDPKVDDPVYGFPPNKENWIKVKVAHRHRDDVSALAWSPDSELFASASHDESLVVHNVRTGKQLWTVAHHRSFPNGLVWDPRGKYLVTMSTDRRMDIVDAAKGTRLRTINAIEFPETEITTDVHMMPNKYTIFHDDQLMSFVRYADFSPGGELLIVPSGHLEVGANNIYGTYVFRRADFDDGKPFAFLRSPSPTFKVACSPLLFQLCDNVHDNSIGLPYRVIFAVLTTDTVLLYDSQCSYPVASVNGIHYGSLSDANWSPDGRVLVVTSIEGFCSFLRFDISVFGEVLKEMDTPPPSPKLITAKKTPKRSMKVVEAPVVPTDAATEGIRTPVAKKVTAVNKSPQNSILKFMKAFTDTPPAAKRSRRVGVELPDGVIDITTPEKDTSAPTNAGSTANADETKSTESLEVPVKRAKRRIELQTVSVVTLE